MSRCGTSGSAVAGRKLAVLPLGSGNAQPIAAVVRDLQRSGAILECDAIVANQKQYEVTAIEPVSKADTKWALGADGWKRLLDALLTVPAAPSALHLTRAFSRSFVDELRDCVSQSRVFVAFLAARLQTGDIVDA